MVEYRYTIGVYPQKRTFSKTEKTAIDCAIRAVASRLDTIIDDQIIAELKTFDSNINRITVTYEAL